MVLEDISGKSVPAIEVFGLSIKSLVNHLTDLLDKQGTGMDNSEIQWVLTVPAIWTDAAKQIMRKSAVKVSILYLVVRERKNNYIPAQVR